MDLENYYFILYSLLGSAFFSGMELAYISSSRLRIELQKQNEGYQSVLIRILDKNKPQLIAMLLLGNNISLVIYGISMASVLDYFLIDFELGTNVLLILKTVISTLFVLFTAEFLPKVIVQLNPNKFLNMGLIPLVVLYFTLYLPTLIVVGISNVILYIFNSKNQSKGDVFSRVDLEHYVSDLTDRVDVDSGQNSEMIILKNALDFSKIKARDCMIPRTEIIAVELNETPQNVLSLFIKTGLSKIIIYREDIDNIIGYVHCYDFYNKPEKLSWILKPIGFVPNSISGKELMTIFGNQASNVAVVTDEYGGTAGIVTLEDVMEEIFGEIIDEYDKDELFELKISDKEYFFSARMEIDYINETYDLKFPESEDYETLAGFILKQLENIPSKGEVVEIEQGRIIIESVTDRKIEKIKIIKD